MKQTDISVIIPAHNASDYIERAIKSIITQTDMSWEIIIVENGSTDDTYITVSYTHLTLPTILRV